MSSTAEERIVGVLGGMGPEATADYFVKLIRNTPIEREQDHIHVIIDSNPKIPSRSEAIISGQTAEVTRMLAQGARTLERAGAGMIVMPCNTAHVFLPDICAAVSVPVLDMVQETARAVRSALPHARRVGVLATRGTIRSRLYQDALGSHGLETVTPDEHEERRVAQAIEAIKVERLPYEPREELAAVARQLVALGAQAIIAGCTEVPLVLRQQDVTVPLFDSTEILARAAVRWAMS